MKIKQFIQRLFGSPKRKSPSAGTAANPSEKMQKMMAMLSATREEELTCDEVFALLDQFAELAAQGEDVEKLMPLVQHHLNMCADCMEEYRVLENILHNVGQRVL
jgi:predicted component of type VI protein secretion system